MKNGILFIAVALLGIFCGAMLLIAAGLMPYWNSLSPEQFRASFQAIGPHLGNVMVPTMIFSIFAAILSAIVAPPTTRRLWIVAAFLVFAIVPLYALIHGPVNDLLLGDGVLDVATLASLRSKWGLLHGLRLGMGAASFVIAFVAYSKD